MRSALATRRHRTRLWKKHRWKSGQLREKVGRCNSPDAEDEVIVMEWDSQEMAAGKAGRGRIIIPENRGDTGRKMDEETS